MFQSEIDRFFQAGHFAVAGASKDRHKYGNKVLRALKEHGLNVVGLHPKETQVEGIDTFASLEQTPHKIGSLVIVTPPGITEQVVQQAVQHGVKSIWMQPGAESQVAIEQAKSHGVDVIAGGPCILVALVSR